ncbi:Uncharacterised protein [Burkholderia pseudomallei]|nr:Uncharacterised protein [Burkholderia pseudomallei]CAJ3816960.1 Uncharacterised protein [Burkholderia pseudomallei]CAJ4313619.1 Uncharacterised protein [Burkholderia pseudomallei]CAJ5582620.1 Uncharacterised protein [Burkholderia pseudomallei]CAJ5602157.1 Uncharacterised protein [Burkholderia pseudomallei]
MADRLESIASIIPFHNEHLQSVPSEHFEQGLSSDGQSVFDATQFSDIDIKVVSSVEKVKRASQPKIAYQPAERTKVCGERGGRRIRR